MKKPTPKYGCEGGYNADAEGQPHAKKRPFTHASTGRANWRRRVKKAERQEFDKKITGEYLAYYGL